MNPETAKEIKSIVTEVMNDNKVVQKESGSGGSCVGCEVRDLKLNQMASDLSKVKERTGMSSVWKKSFCKDCGDYHTNDKYSGKRKVCNNCETTFPISWPNECPNCSERDDIEIEDINTDRGWFG